LVLSFVRTCEDSFLAFPSFTPYLIPEFRKLPPLSSNFYSLLPLYTVTKSLAKVSPFPLLFFSDAQGLPLLVLLEVVSLSLLLFCVIYPAVGVMC